jgi:hypothetical protein
MNETALDDGRGAAAAARAEEETKKPSIVCVEGKCSEPAPAPSREPGERYLENLKFEVYGIADIALLYRDNIATNGKDNKAGLQNYLTLVSGGRNQSRIGLRAFYKLGARIPGDDRAGERRQLHGRHHRGRQGRRSDPVLQPARCHRTGKDGIGRLTIGRQLSPMYDFLIQIDPMNYSPTFSWVPTTGSGDPTTFKPNAGPSRWGNRF